MKIKGVSYKYWSMREIEHIIKDNIEENQLTQPKLVKAIENYVVWEKIAELDRLNSTGENDDRIAELKKGLKI